MRIPPYQTEQRMTVAMMGLQAGMAIYLGTQLVLRSRRASVIGLLIVSGVALGAVVLTCVYLHCLPTPLMMGDLVIAVLWPAAITLVARLRRRRWDATHARQANAPIAGIACDGLSGHWPARDHHGITGDPLATYFARSGRWAEASGMRPARRSR